MTSTTFTDLLRTYAQTHTQSSAANGTRQEPAVAPLASRNQPWYAIDVLTSHHSFASHQRLHCSGWVRTSSQTRCSAYIHTLFVHHCSYSLKYIAVDSHVAVYVARAIGWLGKSCTREGIIRSLYTARSAKQTHVPEIVEASVLGGRRTVLVQLVAGLHSRTLVATRIPRRHVMAKSFRPRTKIEERITTIVPTPTHIGRNI